MKIDFKKIINIKNVSDLKDFSLDRPIFHSNYLFHYLILINNLNGLKLQKYPIYLENGDGLNGFHLAAKEGNIDILSYFIETYPEYIYNKNNHNNMFIYYLPGEYFAVLMNKYPELKWDELIETNNVCHHIITTLPYNELINFFKVYKTKPKNGNQYLFSLLENNLLNDNQKIKILNNFTDDEINAKAEYGPGLILDTIYFNNKILFDYLIDRNIDLDYYTNDDTYNLCKLCYDEKIDGQLVITKIDSTLDNLSDWAEVFTFKYKMMKYGSETNYFDTYYCNLNPNSKYYKRFAEAGYISGLGETFDMIDKLTVEEILNGYSELNIF